MNDTATLQVGQRLEALAMPAIAHAQAVAYASASLDDNAIHLDAEVARKVGFASPVAHGTLLIAKLEQATRHWCPGMIISRLSIRFVRPLLIDQEFQIDGRVAARDTAGERQGFIIRLVARGLDEKPLCLADVTVRKMPSDMPPPQAS
jgi:acyl dehydratase